MRTEGVNVILVNTDNAILLHLRDDNSSIPFPNTWCLPGGLLEPGETPEQCVLREIQEELGVGLLQIYYLCTNEFSYGVEHTFWAHVDFQVDSIKLTEGQAIRWFSRDEAERLKLGYEDNFLLSQFSSLKPHYKRTH